MESKIKLIILLMSFLTIATSEDREPSTTNCSMRDMFIQKATRDAEKAQEQQVYIRSELTEVSGNDTTILTNDEVRALQVVSDAPINYCCECIN